jgi:hypothetical protein
MRDQTAQTVQHFGDDIAPRGARTVVALIAVVALPAGLLSAITQSPVARGTDYFYYYCVSWLVARGHGGSAYNNRVLGALERRLAAPDRVPHGVIPNVYPPSFAVALAPLTWLPYAVGFLVWLGISVLCLGCAVALLEEYAQFDRIGRVVFRAACIMSLPVVVALLLGQVSCILLALLSGAFLALRVDRQGLAGACLGLCLIKPQYVLPFLLVVVVQRKWRAVAWFGCVAALLFLLPLPVLGISADGNYMSTLLRAIHWGENVGGFTPLVNRSLGGFVQLLLPQAPALWVSSVLDLAALGAVAIVSRGSRTVELPFAFATVVALLASQHVLIHDLTLLILPSAIAWRYRVFAPGATRTLIALLWGAMYAGFSAEFTHRIQLPTMAMAAFAVLLVVIWSRAQGVRQDIDPTSCGRVAMLPPASAETAGA